METKAFCLALAVTLFVSGKLHQVCGWQPAAMAFFQRVMSYLLNEVLVNGLANRWVQVQPGSLRGLASAVHHSWPACTNRFTCGVAAGPMAAYHRWRTPGNQRACFPPPRRAASSGPTAAAACSRTFQRFAIRTNSMMEEAAKKTAEHKEKLGEQSGRFMDVFREELTKGLKVRRGPPNRVDSGAGAQGLGALWSSANSACLGTKEQAGRPLWCCLYVICLATLCYHGKEAGSPGQFKASSCAIRHSCLAAPPPALRPAGHQLQSEVSRGGSAAPPTHQQRMLLSPLNGLEGIARQNATAALLPSPSCQPASWPVVPCNNWASQLTFALI